MGQIVSLVHDTSETDRLDRRSPPEASRRGFCGSSTSAERAVKRAGVATLLGGRHRTGAVRGFVLGCAKAAAVVQVHDKETTIKEVPGPERAVTRTTPGAIRRRARPRSALSSTQRMARGRHPAGDAPDKNGFILLTDAGEQSFYPARIGRWKARTKYRGQRCGRPFLDDLGYCRKLPINTLAVLRCMAAEIQIVQVPNNRRPL